VRGQRKNRNRPAPDTAPDGTDHHGLLVLQPPEPNSNPRKLKETTVRRRVGVLVAGVAAIAAIALSPATAFAADPDPGPPMDLPASVVLHLPIRPLPQPLGRIM